MAQALIKKRTLQPFGIFQDSPSWIDECNVCGHPLKDHGKEGCDHDRTIYFESIAIDGPCGCAGPTIEVEVPAEWLPKPVVTGKMMLAAACCAVAVLVGAWLLIVGMFSL